MMENPLVSLGLIKEAVGNILMTNDDVSALAMPYLDDEDYSFEDWRKYTWASERQSFIRTLQRCPIYG